MKEWKGKWAKGEPRVGGKLKVFRYLPLEKGGIQNPDKKKNGGSPVKGQLIWRNVGGDGGSAGDFLTAVSKKRRRKRTLAVDEKKYANKKMKGAAFRSWKRRNAEGEIRKKKAHAGVRRTGVH